MAAPIEVTPEVEQQAQALYESNQPPKFYTWAKLPKPIADIWRLKALWGWQPPAPKEEELPLW